jgi:hypothetical protein
MKGDRVEAVVDTGQGVQTFEIEATRAGRRIEVVTSRGVVEVREVTRTGVPVRTGRFMTSRLVALVEHPAADELGRVEETTRHRISGRERGGSPRDAAARRAARAGAPSSQESLGLAGREEAAPGDQDGLLPATE